MLSDKELLLFTRQAILEVSLDNAKSGWVKDALKKMIKENKMIIRTEKQDGNFERVESGDFIKGVIEDVHVEESHVFKGFADNPDATAPGVRFVFRLDGYEHKHYSRWMKASTHEKANLMVKYISQLVENAVPYMSIEIELLKGMKIKTLWNDKKFQSIETIRPDGAKLAIAGAQPVQKELSEDSDVPF